MLKDYLTKGTEKSRLAYCSLTAEQALTDILLIDNDNDDRRKLKTKAVKIECRTRAPNAYGV